MKGTSILCTFLFVSLASGTRVSQKSSGLERALLKEVVTNDALSNTTMCETEDFPETITEYPFMTAVEEQATTLFHIYGEAVIAEKHQFLAMAAMPGGVGSSQYKVSINGEDWGMTYFAVKGEGCTSYTSNGCVVDESIFGKHKGNDNTPSAFGFTSFFGAGWGKATNKYRIPKAVRHLLGDFTIELEPCGYDSGRVCALVQGTNCYLKRVHVCSIKPKSIALKGIARDGGDYCEISTA